MRKSYILFAILFFAYTAAAQQQRIESVFVPGNLVVYRVGDGSAPLTSAAAPVFLDEYTKTGILVQSIALPTVVSGSNKRITATGNAVSEGGITLSNIGGHLIVTGYDAAVGTGSVANTSSTSVNRVVGVVDHNGNVNSTTAFSDNSFSFSNIRGAASTDGISLWVSGTGVPTSNGGIRFTTIGSASSTQLSTTVFPLRHVNIFNGQVYVTSASGAFHSISQVGTGTPTTSGQTTTVLPGMPTFTGPSPYAFDVKPGMGDVIYIADDNPLLSDGGIQKWVLNSGIWSLDYILNDGLTAGVIGLIVDWDEADPVIFATTADNKLVRFLDDGATSICSTLVTLAANTAFRGVAFVPEDPAAPDISVPSSLPDDFFSLSGIPSAEQSFTVCGSNLINNVVLSPGIGFEISTTSGTGYIANPGSITLSQFGGVLPCTTIYARMNSATPGPNAGNIVITSTGAVTKNVAVSGNVLAPEPTYQDTPTVFAETDFSLDLDFSGGDGNKTLVLASTVNDDPFSLIIDGTTPTANAVYGMGSKIGKSYVVFFGTGNTQTVTGLIPGTQYFFWTYETNDGDVPGAENVLTTSPGTGSATTTSSAATYIYTGGGGNNLFTNPSNFSPPWLTFSPDDVLQFISGTYTVTDVPTRTIGQLKLSGNSNVTLQTSAANTLTISGGTGDDLTILESSQLNIDGPNPIILSLLTGTTGNIAGSLRFTNGAHRLLAADPGAVKFVGGGSFTQGTGFTGNPFGTTNLNSIFFDNNSLYDFIAGGDPFGAVQPKSVIVLDPGSEFEIPGTVQPTFRGRIFGTVKINSSSGSFSASGLSPLTIHDLNVTQGSIFLGNNILNLKGNVSVAPGANLFFSAPTGTVRFNGTSAQSINNNGGSISWGTSQNVAINNPNGVAFNTDASFGTSGTLYFLNGKLVVVNNNITASNVSGGNANSYIKTNGTGTFTHRNIGTTPITLPVGNSTYNPLTIANGSGHNWSLRLEDNVASGNSPYAVQRTWHINPSTNPPVGPANLTLQYNDGDASQIGAQFNTGENVQVWRNIGGSIWVPAGNAQTPTGPPGSTRTVTWSGSDFSPFAISNISGPLPVIFDYVKATQVPDGVKVEWSNMTETEIVNYNVERSVDGRNFTSIGVVNARLNNGGRVDYSFMDVAPFSGVNFYRIKSLETSGKNKYSIVVRVDLRGGATQLVLYPNPTTDGQISYQANNLVKGFYTIKVFNSVGQQVYSKVLNHPGGSVSEAIRIPSAKPGVYSLQLISRDNRFVKTFAIQ